MTTLNTAVSNEEMQIDLISKYIERIDPEQLAEEDEFKKLFGNIEQENWHGEFLGTILDDNGIVIAFNNDSTCDMHLPITIEFSETVNNEMVFYADIEGEIHKLNAKNVIPHACAIFFKKRIIALAKEGPSVFDLGGIEVARSIFADCIRSDKGREMLLAK